MPRESSDQGLNLYYQRVALLYQRPEIKASIEVILSVFTIALLIIFAIAPTITNIAKLQKKIEDQQKVLTQADNKMAKLISAQSQMTTYQDKLDLFDMAVPDSFGYFGMIKRIEILTAKNNVTLTKLSLPASIAYGNSDPTKIKAVQMSKLLKADTNNLIQAEVLFGVDGSPSNVISFLSDMENMDRSVLINSIKLSKPQSTVIDKSKNLTADGSAIFYFYKAQN